jgi:hypothetical protein
MREPKEIAISIHDFERILSLLPKDSLSLTLSTSLQMLIGLVILDTEKGDKEMLRIYNEQCKDDPVVQKVN